MTPERWQQVERVYHAARASDTGARDALLDELCRGDDALRREVVSLLEQQGDAHDFLSEPAIDLTARGMAARADSLPTGTQIGGYRIVALLGAGGMGEVYRARDAHLGRDVAIKILPLQFTADPDHRARFSREARLLAALNHPHIGAIYGLEEVDGVSALVLELVEGPTLAERLARGPLPVSDCLRIARQIAEGLEAAHAKGIVHRDLKPGNIVIEGAGGGPDVPTGDLRAKLLDFGLGKAMAVGPDRDLTQSLSLDATADGRILGTPAYMSPEQARGQAVDKRTDIWAFGCVLFEMLSGRAVFGGDTISDTVVSILEHEPDWSALPAPTPVFVANLLRRCLRKDATKRLHDIADARIELEDSDLESATLGESRIIGRSRPSGRLAWLTASLLAAALVGVIGFSTLRRPPAAAATYVEFGLRAPRNARFWGPSPQFALAPDGSLGFVAYSQGRPPMLWVREVGTLDPRVIPGSEGASSPFWKPDSRELGFRVGGKLKTVTVRGGVPFDVCDVPEGEQGEGGATWSRDDVIVFGGVTPGSLMKVPAKSGNPSTVTTLEGGDLWHRWPSFLPDGRHFLYLAGRNGGSVLRVGSLDGTPSRSVGPIESNAIYASGHLLFANGGQLLARPFDVSSFQTYGEPVSLARATTVLVDDGRAAFAVTESGWLAYHKGTVNSENRLTWLRRTGTPLGTVGDLGQFVNLDLSADDQQLAVSSTMPDRTTDIWVYNLARNDGTPLTTTPAHEYDPVWSRDGADIAFSSNRTDRRFSLYRRASNGSGEDQLLAAASTSLSLPDWSPDGQSLVYDGPGGLWLRRLTGDQSPYPFGPLSHNEHSGAFSPDGRWIAYWSDRTGRPEVYVCRFPSGEDAHKVSLDGGMAPRWRPADGKELFFLSLDGTMMVAGMEPANRMTAGIPARLFATDLQLANGNPYAVARDGQRFLVPVPIESPEASTITVVQNWTASLSK